MGRSRQQTTGRASEGHLVRSGAMQGGKEHVKGSEREGSPPPLTGQDDAQQIKKRGWASSNARAAAGKGRGMGGGKGDRVRREGPFFGARFAGFKRKMSTGEVEEECCGTSLEQYGVLGAQVEGVSQFVRHGEHTSMELQGGLMWCEEIQGAQTIDLERDI
ncbi:hypothetical protein NDU88_006783 [Pleurodeles waltl]|uniref:Uncharacterized protein n=1 Tax=Pleurodeles waltl TaxID=8319 RepID=A0AAV7WYJ9_PLEWA|nr:hypothetical protein NDU88_006783 [Pleurodeles waltl]